MAFDSALLNNPGPGFEVIERSGDRVVLNYKQPMRGCLIAFLIVFAIFWCTLGGIFTVLMLPLKLGAIFGFVILGLGLFGLFAAARPALTTHTFTVDPEVLTISTGGAGQSARRTVDRSEITRIFVRLQIVQGVSAGAGGPMTSRQRIWSVVAYTPSAVKVLPSGGQRQCEWLGNLLGEWAGCLVEMDN